jgi:hypothetical protein
MLDSPALPVPQFLCLYPSCLPVPQLLYTFCRPVQSTGAWLTLHRYWSVMTYFLTSFSPSGRPAIRPGLRMFIVLASVCTCTCIRLSLKRNVGHLSTVHAIALMKQKRMSQCIVTAIWTESAELATTTRLSFLYHSLMCFFNSVIIIISLDLDLSPEPHASSSCEHKDTTLTYFLIIPALRAVLENR